MNKEKHGQRKTSRVWAGPAISVVLAGLIIIQTLVNDPTSAFTDEILSQIERPRIAIDPSSDEYHDYHSFFRSKRSIGHHGSDRHISLVKLPGVEHGPEQNLLFRPSIWPYDAPKASQDTEGIDQTSNEPRNMKYPGKSTVFTDYKRDTIVEVDRFMEMDDKVVLPKLREKNSAYATCRLRDYQYSFYFPHFAQQVFRCWSFFKSHPDKRHVFVTSQNENDYHWKLVEESKFNRGLLDVFQQAGVEILGNSEVATSESAIQSSISASSVGPLLQPGETHFQVRSLEDMKTFRESTHASQNITKLPSAFCGHPSGVPRIAVLSRRKSRKIKRVRELTANLQEHFNLTYSIPVAYFEEASFRDQVGMMGSIDILITPHGAQETGIAFMPECGGVLELLPDDYFFPRFYGTLAATVGIEHAYIYLAENTSDHTVDVKLRDVGFLYPSFERILDGVEQLMGRWRQCCQGVNRRESLMREFSNLLEDN